MDMKEYYKIYFSKEENILKRRACQKRFHSKEENRLKRKEYNKVYYSKEENRLASIERAKKNRAQRISNETEEERKIRVQKNAEYLKSYHSKAENKSKHYESNKKRQAKRISSETEEEKLLRLQKKAEYQREWVKRKKEEKGKEVKPSKPKKTKKEKIEIETVTYSPRKNTISLIQNKDERKKSFEQNKTDEKVKVIKSSNEISFLIQSQDSRGLTLKKSYFK